MKTHEPNVTSSSSPRTVHTTCRRCGITIYAHSDEARPLCLTCDKIERRDGP